MDPGELPIAGKEGQKRHLFEGPKLPGCPGSAGWDPTSQPWCLTVPGPHGQKLSRAPPPTSPRRNNPIYLPLHLTGQKASAGLMGVCCVPSCFPQEKCLASVQCLQAPVPPQPQEQSSGILVNSPYFWETRSQGRDCIYLGVEAELGSTLGSISGTWLRFLHPAVASSASASANTPGD